MHKVEHKLKNKLKNTIGSTQMIYMIYRYSTYSTYPDHFWISTHARKVSTRSGMLGSLGKGGNEQPDHNQGAGQIDVLEVDWADVERAEVRTSILEREGNKQWSNNQ